MPTEGGGWRLSLSPHNDGNCSIPPHPSRYHDRRIPLKKASQNKKFLPVRCFSQFCTASPVPIIIPLHQLSLVTRWHFSHHLDFLTCRMQPLTITSFLCCFKAVNAMAFEIQQSSCHEVLLPGDRWCSATTIQRGFCCCCFLCFCWRYKLLKPQITLAPNLYCF